MIILIKEDSECPELLLKVILHNSLIAIKTLNSFNIPKVYNKSILVHFILKKICIDNQ